MSSSLSALVMGTVEVGVVVEGAVVGGVVDVGADVFGPIFIRMILKSDPCLIMPAIMLVPFPSEAISENDDSCVGNGSTNPFVPKLLSTTPDVDTRATPEKLLLRY